jgi:hypothetical protein
MEISVGGFVSRDAILLKNKAIGKNLKAFGARFLASLGMTTRWRIISE